MDVNQHDCWFVACRFVHSFAIQYESVVKNKSDDLNTFFNTLCMSAQKECMDYSFYVGGFLPMTHSCRIRLIVNKNI